MRSWTAKWIWAKDNRDVNAHLLFRKDVTVDDAPRTVKLHVAAESFCVVWVNGREVCRTSSLSYPGQHYYETVDVTDALSEGLNRIAVLAWYIGIPSGSSCPKDPGLLCEFVGDDGTIVAATDDSWSVLTLDAWLGRHRRSLWLNLDLIEILDFRRLPTEFPMVTDLSAFEPVAVIGTHGVRYVRIEPRPFPKPTGEPLDVMTISQAGTTVDRSAEFDLPAEAVTTEVIEPGDLGIVDPAAFLIAPTQPGRAATVIFDLGDYEKGFPALTVSGCEGAVVDISWYEHLADQDPTTSAAKVYTTDRYILSGRTDRIIPEEWKCGRYLQLTFRSVTWPLTVESFQWLRRHYPLSEKATFRSSDPTLERIWRIGLNAAAACMHDNIMDCPWRERRQWIGDAQRIGLVNHYAFGDRDLVRGVLRQQVQMQDPSGRIFVCLPIFEEYPSQSMEWLRAVLEYQHHTGDETLLEEIIDNVEMLHRWFMRCRDKRGLLFIGAPPVMNWMDNPYGSVLAPGGSVRGNQHRTAFAALNLRYLLFLDDVATSLDQFSREAAADQARQERRRLEALIGPSFTDDATGLLRDCAETDIAVTFSEFAHALAVTAQPAGLDAEAMWDRFQTYRVEHGDSIIEAGPFGKYATFEALGKLGRPEAIVAAILKWWAPMVEEGSDTTWEHFNGKGSRCHGWAGTPVVALMRHILHLDPTKAGKARAENISGVEWMECEVAP